MNDSDKGYGAARALLSFAEFVGWVTVIFGLILAVIGASTVHGSSGPFGLSSGSLALIAAMDGLVAAVGGLFMVVIVHTMRAVIDTAETTREILYLARRQAGSSPDPFGPNPYRREPIAANGSKASEADAVAGERRLSDMWRKTDPGSRRR